MNTIKVRNIDIGAGSPKICVPIVGKNVDEIISSAEKIGKVGADLVEWRIDWFDKVDSIDATIEVLGALRKVLDETPILVTFRTSKEGGERAIDADSYVKLNCEIAKSGLADLVDIEVFTGDDYVREVVKVAHENKVFVVGSNHDFYKTPEEDEIIFRLRKMQDLGVDIPKIALMPQSKRDVITLLSATEKMYSKYADRPIVTMSMAGTGAISRLSGEVFGSSITFGAVGKASAPGQVNVEDLRTVLNIISRSI